MIYFNKKQTVNYRTIIKLYRYNEKKYCLYRVQSSIRRSQLKRSTLSNHAALDLVLGGKDLLKLYSLVVDREIIVKNNPHKYHRSMFLISKLKHLYSNEDIKNTPNPVKSKTLITKTKDDLISQDIVKPQTTSSSQIHMSKRPKRNKAALVIGNSNYKKAPLRNAVNDALDISLSLKELGFNVITKSNVNVKQMSLAIDKFFQISKTADQSVFFYAGHGIQIEGQNFLLPIGTDIQTESDIKYDAYPAGKIVERLGRKKGAVNIVILDACRNNPFKRSFRSSSMGLANMDAPTGTILIYATAPGSVAADGNGRNGVFTEYFLKYLKEPGLDIHGLIMKTRNDVIAETKGKQVPWESSSLTDYFYFNPK